VTIFCSPSTGGKNGCISKVVPMVSHADHTEHDTMVFITEQGVADLRGLGPLQRARAIIENCAHPDYRYELADYLRYAVKHGGHEPVDLGRAFSFHKRLAETGTMLPTPPELRTERIREFIKDRLY